jgi:hypothetical protein
MVRTLLLALAVAWVASPVATAQQRPSASASRPLVVEVHAGYTTFSMDEATVAFRNGLAAYRDLGVIAPAQQTYPGNGIAGADVLLALRPWIHLGLGGRTARTQAVSLYGDYAGTLDARATTRLWTLEGIARLQRLVGPRVHLFGDVRGGLAVGQFTLRETVRLDLRALVPNRPLNEAVQTGTATLDATGPGVAASGFVGLRFTLGRAVVSAQTGYRYARVVGAQGEGVASTGAVIFEGDLPFALGYAGWTSTLGLGVVLW